MSSVVDEGIRRPHDADATRRDLLDAGAALFEERGYQGATLRDIGERAGVDPALVARYFGSKEGLYLASLSRDGTPTTPTDARGLVAASDSDVDNLYITLSARAARLDLQIVARASTEDAATKLDRAGADRIVQPYATAGQEMAQLMLKPQVAAFLEIVSTHAGPDLRFEEIVVTRASGQVGRTIRELRIRRDTGAVVITIRRSDGTFETTPSPDHALVEGDVLIAVGTETELRALEELFAVREAVAD